MKFRCVLAIFLVFYFLSSTASLAAPLSLKRIGLEQGLSQSTIYSIAQDHSGYIWFGTGDGIDIYDGYSFEHLRNETDDINSLSSNYVKALLVSKDGSIWIGTLGGGLNRYDPNSETFIRYQSERNDAYGVASEDIYSLYESEDGLIWAGSGEGISVFNQTTNNFSHYFHSENNSTSIQYGPIRAITQTSDGAMWFGSSQSGISSLAKESDDFLFIKHITNDEFSLSDNAVNALYQDTKGNLWVGTEFGGLNKVDTKTRKVTRYANFESNEGGLNTSEVTSFLEDEKGGLWLGTGTVGLSYFNPITERFKYYRYSPGNRDSISSDTVISLFSDHSGMLWVGTFDNGVNLVDYQGSGFEHYQHDPVLKNSVVDNMIWAISEDSVGNIWVGTKNGLSHYEPKNGRYKAYFKEGHCQNIISNSDIRSILVDNDRLWLGTAGGGLLKFNPADCGVEHYLHDETNPYTLSDNHARLLLKDSQQQIWIGTRNGLNKLDLNTGKIKRYQSKIGDSSALPHNRIRALYEDDEGVIWVGTSGGLSRFDPTLDSFDNITAEQGLLSDNDVRNIWKDSKGALWIATGKGLTRLDVRLKSAQFFYEKDGLTNNALYNLLVDGEYLWITTNNGLSRFNRNNHSFLNFDISDGLQSNEFNINAALKSKSGYFYVGGINGFNRFLPERLNNNKVPPKIDLKVESESIIDSFMIHNDIQALILSASDRKITFTTSVIHYLNPSKNEYQYRLLGYDENWIRVNAKNKHINYSSLPAGDYFFQIKGYASNGIVNEQTVSQPIIVKPALWRTWWAYILYMAALLFLINYVLHLRTKKLILRSKLLEHSVKVKTAELEQKNYDLNHKTRELEVLLKNQDDFYLGIAHELRTPLTLIQTPSELLLTMHSSEKAIKSLNIILNATYRLKSLSDQMLVAAAEGKVHQGGVVTFDLRSHIISLTHIYQLEARKKNIEYSIIPVPIAAITINKQILDSTLHNLLSNAFRYTQSGGQISVETLLRDDNLQLIVKDNGMGISQNKQSTIFNRYTRTERAQEFSPEGNGIGLYTVKQNLNNCGGTINVSSSEGKGSTFTACLPCEFSLSNTTPLTVEHNTETSSVTSFVEKPSVLIIEDDPDIGALLVTVLEGKYQVTLIGSANQGLLQAEKVEHDLVLCDVMLPDGNGFEITRILKNSESTSHIPLILITAVADMAGHKTGWDNGADDYIVKPFTTDDLLYRISAVLKNRQRLQKWYQSKILHRTNSKDEETLINSTQSQYINELQQATMILIENRQCNLEELAKAMKQSGRTLQRRLKSLLGCGFSEYIKSVQLSRARELLEQKYLVKEVAYKAGFSDPTYFGKLFKKEFSVTPSEYRSRFIKSNN